MRLHHSGITLLELLIAVSLLSLLIIGFSGIELFSRYQVISADKRTRVQNEAAHVVEHISKNIANAIGDRNDFPVANIPDGASIRVDSNRNGRRDAADTQIAYRFLPGNIMRYYSNYPGSFETISQKISNFTWTVVNNSFEVEVVACDDPDSNPFACGTSDNPAAEITTRINMPSVSTN